MGFENSVLVFTVPSNMQLMWVHGSPAENSFSPLAYLTK